MGDEMRMLVTKIILTRDGNVELFERGHRFRDTLLFDPSDLMDVGIDPNTLSEGEERSVRFWAYYTLSDKLNKEGNPYKDVSYLERVDAPPVQNGTADEDPAVLELLRGILVQARLGNEQLAGMHQLLERAFFAGSIPSFPAAPPFDGDADEPPPELESQQPAAGEQPQAKEPAGGNGNGKRPDLPPISEDEARRLFYQRLSAAMKECRVDPAKANALSTQGKVKGWRDALAALDGMIEEAADA